MKPYYYVGPPEVCAQVLEGAMGARMESIDDLKGWLRNADREPGKPAIIATFVIDREGYLRLASRRTEHVACAGGDIVLSAGEITFPEDGSPEAVEITNQSTGYCPEPESWNAVEKAFNQIGVKSSGGFTTEFLFRRCDSCGQINIVKSGWFECAVCEANLPSEWNFDQSENG